MRAFEGAWRSSVSHYLGRRLNGEAALQACLYHYLLNSLPPTYRVFPEAVVHLGRNVQADAGKRKVVIDLLVEYDQRIVAGIELKFTPRGEPTSDHIRKDLTSLACLTSRRATDDRVAIEMPRFHSTADEPLRLSILPQRKLIFALYCSKQATSLSQDNFWKEPRRPSSGYWADRTAMPPNFGLALIRTSSEPAAEAKFYGPPFDRQHILAAHTSDAVAQVNAQGHAGLLAQPCHLSPAGRASRHAAGRNLAPTLVSWWTPHTAGATSLLNAMEGSLRRVGSRAPQAGSQRRPLRQGKPPQPRPAAHPAYVVFPPSSMNAVFPLFQNTKLSSAFA